MFEFRVNTKPGDIDPKERKSHLALTYTFILRLEPPPEESDQGDEESISLNEKGKPTGGSVDLMVEENPRVKGDFTHV